jgi:hypothetical protein
VPETAGIHALGLLAARRLAEAQERVLEARIDEIQRATRLHEVDEELAYLPHAIVRQITAMLRDGRINAWERDHLLTAIRDAPALSDAQREHAREVIERWAARDAPTEGRA